MKKRLFVKHSAPLLIAALLLASCQAESASVKGSLINRLTDYEASYITDSIQTSFKGLSYIKSEYHESSDDSALYGDADKTLASAYENRVYTDTSFYSNYVILKDEVSTTETSQGGITIGDTSEVKTLQIVLETTEEGAETKTYGLFQKTYTKNATATLYGTSYSVISADFATSANLDERWNKHIVSFVNANYVNFGGVSNYYKDESGSITGLYNSTTSSKVSNPVFPQDSTKIISKSVTTATSFDVSQNNNGYYVSSWASEESTVYVCDYFGNALTKGDGTIASVTGNGSFSYDPKTYNGKAFTLTDYNNYVKKTPVLYVCNEGADPSVYGGSFENISVSYQQVYSSTSYAYSLSQTLIADTSYCLGTEMDAELETPVYSSFKRGSYSIEGAKLIWDYSSSSFSVDTTGEYQILVLYSSDFSNATVKLTLL